MAKRQVVKPLIKTTGGISKTYSWKIHYILLSILSGILVYFCSDINHIQDDAYITFRYVDNLIHSKGLVFNEGEFVEGFTSILWVLLLSALALLRSNLPGTSQILSIASSILVLFVTYKISELVINENSNQQDIHGKNKNTSKTWKLFNLALRISPSLLLTFTGAFIYWSVSGMEATFFILVNLCGIYFYIKDKDKPTLGYGFAISMLLATLTRPEGAMMVVLILFHSAASRYLKKREEGFVKAIKYLFTKQNLKCLAIIIIPNVLLILFRLFYYGYPLPNTFYAKTGLSSVYFSAGLNYFFDFASSYLLYGVIILLPLILFKTRARSIAALFYLLIFVNTVYVISVGGDVLPFSRFFLPILPLLYILFAASFQHIYFLLRNKLSKNLLVILGPFIIVLILGTSWFNYSFSYDKIKRSSKLEKELVNKMTGSATWLAQRQLLLKKPIVVAATTIGALSYYSKITIIDMLGLTDEEIAHHPKYIEEISGVHAGWKERKYNVDYVLSRKPDYILFSTGIKPSAYAERALFINENFVNNYYSYFFKIWPDKKYVETIYSKRPPEIINPRRFSENPNYSDNYVHIYNQVLNYKSDTTKADLAINLCEELTKQAPVNFGDSYRLLGSTYKRIGEKEKAYENYEKAYHADITNGPANLELFFYYRALRDTANVIKHYYALKRYNPTVLNLYGIK